MAVNETPLSDRYTDWHRAQQQAHRRQFFGRLLLTAVTALVVVVFVFPIFFWFRLSITPFRYVFVDIKQPTQFPRIDFPEVTWTWWSVILGQKTYAEAQEEQTGTRLSSGVGGGGSDGYVVAPRILNSVVYGLLSTGIVIVVATFTAYALSRFETRGKQNVVFFIISTRFMPPVAVVLPLLLIYREIGWYDTRHGIFLAHVVINLPLAILLIKSFFDDVPRDLDEAAMVDGCTRFGAFWRIVARYVTPGIAAAAVLSFIFSWNEFIFTLYMARSPEFRTIPVQMTTFDASAGPTEWGLLAAAGTAAMVPVFIFILFVQRYLIRGLTLGAVK
ncbi:MAG: carbohydrate ABC transporter permease [Anaerolineae bacterium]